ncbi:MAG: peptidoglycan DD-metalloendopeptidase family protein [Pseudomonadota bacterium]
MGRSLKTTAAMASIVLVAGCSSGFDIDFRDIFRSDADTTAASQATAASRPVPDERGVISYETYQVVVAKRADTVATVAQRIAMAPETLARFNGVRVNDSLREGEILAIPSNVELKEAGIPNPGQVDVTTLAGAAIDNAEAAQTPNTSGLPDTGVEPIRHRVARGETAFTIARLYGVSPRDLATWNGLGSDLEVREGQFLLIPVQAPDAEVAQSGVTAPGTGSATPTPPSASQPLPVSTATAAAGTAASAAPSAVPRPQTSGSTASSGANIGASTSASASNAKFVFPVSGNIIRDYKKGVNDGIDIQASPGAPVKAAESGTVAAITRNTDQVPIIILRHTGGLLTVYANVDDVKVAKGDSVSRGQTIASIRKAEPVFLHFEVRRGLESTDPVPFLE